MSDYPAPSIPSVSGEPAWEVAQLFPNQGGWTEADFLNLRTDRMAELVDGRLEVLPMPTWLHQLIVDYLCDALKRHIATAGGGRVLFAPLPVRLFSGTIREPDVLYVSADHLPPDPRGYPEHVDLVMEVVSSGEDSRRRDYEDKRRDYARAGIREYWIVDPERERITVLALEAHQYREAGIYAAGDTASSEYLPGFTLKVAEIIELGSV